MSHNKVQKSTFQLTFSSFDEKLSLCQIQQQTFTLYIADFGRFERTVNYTEEKERTSKYLKIGSL
jgi:hypothetical protein